jgi:hypothetical protein
MSAIACKLVRLGLARAALFKAAGNSTMSSPPRDCDAATASAAEKITFGGTVACARCRTGGGADGAPI